MSRENNQLKFLNGFRGGMVFLLLTFLFANVGILNNQSAYAGFVEPDPFVFDSVNPISIPSEEDVETILLVIDLDENNDFLFSNLDFANLVCLPDFPGSINGIVGELTSDSMLEIHIMVSTAGVPPGTTYDCSLKMALTYFSNTFPDVEIILASDIFTLNVFSVEFDSETYGPNQEGTILAFDGTQNPEIVDFRGVELFLSDVSHGFFGLQETGVDTGEFVGYLTFVEFGTEGPGEFGVLCPGETAKVVFGATGFVLVASDIADVDMICIETAFQQTKDLGLYVSQQDISPGIKKSLIKLLDSLALILNDDDPGNDGDACGKIDAFILKLSAQDGKKINNDLINELKLKALEIRDNLGLLCS